MPAWVAPAVGAGVSALISYLMSDNNSSNGQQRSSGGGMPSGGQLHKFPIYSGPQQAAQNKALGQGLGGLGTLSSLPSIPPTPELLNLPSQGQYNFAPIAQQARNRFYGTTLPSLAERFRGMGEMSGSSGLNYSQQQGSSDFESQLAALEAQFGQQERGLEFQEKSAQNKDLISLFDILGRLQLAQQGQQRSGIAGLLQTGLSPQFSSYFQPPAQQQPSAWSNLLGGLGQGLGALGSAYAGSWLGGR